MSKHESRRELRFSIIGAGRLGTALALALQSNGHQIASVVNRTRKGAARAIRVLGSAVLPLTAESLSDLPPADVVLITTPDDEIRGAAQALSRLSLERRRTVLHSSGALSSEILLPLGKSGSHIGSLHPLVSISEPRAGAIALKGCFYCIEGDRPATAIARRIVRELGGRHFSVKTDKKALYHAAAVMSSGHVVALLDLAMEMLVRCGLTKAEARKVLVPLVQSTLNNLLATDSERSLTGTFSRGDRSTVKEHLKALGSARSEVALAAYRVLGRHSLTLAKRRRKGTERGYLEELLRKS
ncbi:MAG TPA: DUF2520 domain-containing protein [Pyrinomonadaceae bacterium]|nr:DUF2520 domain-containing protein [Pyrinomonadaceae bacterium]